MASPAIPVAVHGFTWGAGLLALLNVLVGGALVQWIRTRAAMKKIEADREANLLQERAAEMAEMRQRIDKLEAKLERREVEHEAERAASRHKIVNLSACFDAMLFMLDGNPSPERVKDAVAKIREMRANQMETEALEKATIHAAKIARTGPNP